MNRIPWPLVLAIIGGLISAAVVYGVVTLVSERLQVARERKEQCAEYDRDDRGPCLIVRVLSAEQKD